MRLKVFRAATMQAALARLRAELGPDALILSARTVKEGVELTAGMEQAEPPPAGAVDDPQTRAMLAYHGVPAPLARLLSGGGLGDRLERSVRFAPINAAAGPLLFVGPPGAGKTSTVARLATRLVLGGARPLVITADGRRAGATEQLAAYTRLLGVNLVVATHPVTLGRAMTRREPGAPVLIDAPGGDCQMLPEMEELSALAATSGARIALVLPAGLDPAEAADIAAAHEQIGATLLVATRLDLARRLGGIFAAAMGKLALAEAGVGPGAADGLVPCTAALLADRMLRTAPCPPIPHQEYA